MDGVPDPLLAEAQHDLRCCFLEGQKSRGQSWEPEMITLLTYASNLVFKMRQNR